MTHQLTERERQVLGHLVFGRSNKIIAYRLGISHFTVRDHVSNIMAKLNVDNRFELAALVIRKDPALVS